jgi:hypothetical protein
MNEQILPTMRTVTRASVKEISMRAGLFIPCYMDAFEPEVGIAMLEFVANARECVCGLFLGGGDLAANLGAEGSL